LLDSSPAVRDAAVELIGKYMIESPEVVGDYYTKIADRIAVGVFHRLEAHLADFFRIRDLEFGNV
jgi:cohesin loading factor subunit SCC2